MAEDRQPERRGAPGHGSTDPDAPGRGRRRGMQAAAVAVVLLGLVAVGSLRGPLGSGRGRPRYPADLIDSLLLLLVLAMLAAAVLAALAMWTDRRMIGRRPRRGGNLSLLLPMAAVLLLWLFRDLFGLGGAGDDPPATTLPDQSTIDAAVPPPDPGGIPLVVAGLALTAMIGLAVAQLLAERRRRRPPRTPGERLVELLDDTLEDLEREPDPRRAVIAAWARMERGLAAAGLPRRPAEAPFEYAGRVLEAALARPASVHRLTGLFERAKFSRHPVGQADRDQAIDALRTVRRELTEAAAQAEAAAAAGVGGGAAGRGAGR
ncbi:MAG: DUF4129 domain-containing protein [Actinomycetota bacterium]